MLPQQTKTLRSFLRVLFFLGIAGLLALTTIGYVGLNSLVKAQAQSRYEKEAKRLTTQIGDEVNSHADILFRARGFILVNRTPTQAEWEVFFNSQGLFNENKSVDGVTFSRYYANKNIANIEREMSVQHKTSLKVWPAGERTEYAPVAVLASANPERATFLGYDQLSEETRRIAMNEARTTAQPVLSAPLTIVTNGKQAVMMTLPVYVENSELYGYISAFYYTDALMNNVFDEDNNAQLAAQIVDNKTNAEIYRSSVGVMGTSIARSDKMSVGGREWVINYAPPAPVFGDGHLVPTIVMAVGVIFTLGFMLTANTVLRITDPERQKAVSDLASPEKSNTTL